MISAEGVHHDFSAECCYNDTCRADCIPLVAQPKPACAVYTPMIGVVSWHH